MKATEQAQTPLPYAKSIHGRRWDSAHKASIMAYEGGDTFVRLDWEDGEHVQWCEPTYQGAIDRLRGLGWITD